MFNRYFYDIPVYRVSEEEYYQQRKSHKDSHFLFGAEMDEFYTRNPEYKIHNEEHINKQYGGMWRFNEIIGYIRLRLSGPRILGEWYENDVKRHVKTRNKQFIYKTDKLAIEIDIYEAGSNVEIYEAILSYLKVCHKELPKRYIDIGMFATIGPYVDWKSLLESKI